ncbi:helix-hairpin-helix domain-containing protein [Paraglaciecola aquimarina]|uniref:Helix-hairpin-helix domain-containing protein n=1 Tax=Paraglaciecola aquimarina TaxID=1235557 RepID=A0ABU3T0F9_9ALTE|nr:helix-hairpin-helix domain-containing protein [Paraglaciecola aquimarina]MDU0355756.1 helix-hairpin-helix domain-containing protein [Paraglaciecola aquimarina]
MEGYLTHELDDLIGSEVAENLRVFWKKYNSKNAAIEFLVGMNVSIKNSRSVYALYADKTIEKITENFYRLTPIQGFSKTDLVAKKHGIRSNDPRRLCALGNEIVVQHMKQFNSSLLRKNHSVKLQQHTLLMEKI